MSKPAGMRPAALGLRAHSGWAALVAVAKTENSPYVILRRRIETCDPAVRCSKQPFHAAESLDLSDAEALIQKCRESTQKLSRKALRAAADELRGKGFEIIGCGVILGSGRTLPDLKAILASHALLHTAEGEFFRKALVEAGRHCGLPVIGLKERDALEEASQKLHISASDLQKRITEMGRGIGPPWTQDQKYAALAGWLATLPA